MPLLFSYGTLQREDVQVATFGRVLRGEADALVAFTLTSGRHVNASFTGRPEDRVEGIVYEVTDQELAAADVYERQAAYTRVRAALVSGRGAWVYVETRPLQ